MEYEQHRNILMLGTTGGNIIFMDTDKNRVTNYIQTGFGSDIVHLLINPSVPNLMIFDKDSAILGLFLPPHSKKFKPSCSLGLDSKFAETKVSAVATSSKKMSCFIGYENGAIIKLNLSDQAISHTDNSNSATKLPQGSIEPRKDKTISEVWGITLD